MPKVTAYVAFSSKSKFTKQEKEACELAIMLDFASRHSIVPKTGYFAMSHINKAFEYLEAGKARYRIDADF